MAVGFEYIPGIGQENLDPPSSLSWPDRRSSSCLQNYCLLLFSLVVLAQVASARLFQVRRLQWCLTPSLEYLARDDDGVHFVLCARHDFSRACDAHVFLGVLVCVLRALRILLVPHE